MLNARTHDKYRMINVELDIYSVECLWNPHERACRANGTTNGQSTKYA